MNIIYSFIITIFSVNFLLSTTVTKENLDHLKCLPLVTTVIITDESLIEQERFRKITTVFPNMRELDITAIDLILDFSFLRFTPTFPKILFSPSVLKCIGCSTNEELCTSLESMVHLGFNSISVLGKKSKFNRAQAMLWNKSSPPVERITADQMDSYCDFATGMLESTDANGKNYRGTAVLIGKNIALTAAHNVWCSESKDYYKDITFYPAYHGKESIFGSYKVMQSFCPGTYQREYQSGCQATIDDYAIVFLPIRSGNWIGNITGYFGLKVLSDSDFKNKQLTIQGYRRDGIYKHSGSSIEVNENFIHYAVETMPGQSGSGVWFKENNDYYLLGIHIYGSQIGNEGNMGVRITTKMIDWINKATFEYHSNGDHYKECKQIYEYAKGTLAYPKAKVIEYRRSAEQGDANAQYNLGVMYRDGQGVGKDDAEAVRWYRKAVDQGLASAQCNLGYMYAYGRGVGKNDSEAVRWYRMATDQGYAKAQYNLGVAYTYGQGVGKNDSEAVRWYRKATDQGYANAQFSLGLAYEFGNLGIDKDYGTAVIWYRMATDQGYAKAQYNLGLAYEFGNLGIDKDYGTAVIWYRKAADQGDAQAQGHLGVMYANGLGVDKNEAEAFRWYCKAAEQGHTKTQLHLGGAYANGQGVDKNEAEAFSWLHKAAEQGDVDAQYGLGCMYTNGQGVDKNEAEAFSWFYKAAEQGHADAKNALKRRGLSQ